VNTLKNTPYHLINSMYNIANYLNSAINQLN
jgi:hypothetical protein